MNAGRATFRNRVWSGTSRCRNDRPTASNCSGASVPEGACTPKSAPRNTSLTADRVVTVTNPDEPETTGPCARNRG